MYYELATMTLPFGTAGNAATQVQAFSSAADAKGELLGCWFTDIGVLNQMVCLLYTSSPWCPNCCPWRPSWRPPAAHRPSSTSRPIPVNPVRPPAESRSTRFNRTSLLYARQRQPIHILSSHM